MEKTIYQIPIKVLSRFFFYQKSQFWDKEKLFSYQNRKLTSLIRHAASNVPYYKKLFKENGIDPDKFTGRDDLKRIPLLDKETVRTKVKELMAVNATKYGLNWDSTSGTSGKPLHFISDDWNQANKIAALLRSYNWMNYRIGNRTLSMQSYYFKDKAFHYNPFFRVLRFDSNHLKLESLTELTTMINKLKPRIFMGFPFDICLLADYVRNKNIDVNLPKSIICYGETLSKHKRKLLQDTFDCHVFNFYSLHESSAMIAECEMGNLHLIDDFAFHEIIDEDGNELTGPGKGKLVGTGYYNYGMPFIRYDIKDEVFCEDRSYKCPCGRNFPVIKTLTGKQCDYLETPDGRMLGAVMSHSIDWANGVICSQCIQKSLELIEVNLITDKNFNKLSQFELEKGLRKRLGNKIKLEFKQVNQLRKSASGKTPFIISEIGNKYK